MKFLVIFALSLSLGNVIPLRTHCIRVVGQIDIQSQVECVEYSKGTKNCSTNLPVLELGLSGSRAQCFHHYTTTTNSIHLTQFYSLFTFV